MFPDELKAFNQWVLWKNVQRDGRETKLPYSPVTGQVASVTDPATWASFDKTLSVASSHKMDGVGFVLTNDDPYAFIDLDNPLGNPEVIARQTKIANAFDTYSELSPSRTGLHLICKGSVPHGCRREKVELYSSSRYMTMTGWTFHDKPIAERDDLLHILWEELGGSNGHGQTYVDQEIRMDGDSIIDRAHNAKDGPKFDLLWNGDWNGAGYHSQSEADFALINILGFYSRNRTQIKELFLRSGLGQRNKAKRPKYVDDMIEKSFDNEIPSVDMTELTAHLKEQIDVQTNVETANPFAGPLFASIPDPTYDYGSPPGLVGEISDYIFNSSAKQIREISLAAAIGLMAGIIGRSYNVSNTGLNQYVLVLAKTGTGKEGMVSGIDRIMRQVYKQCPSAEQFIGPSHIASGQALIKHLALQPCMVSIMGEFGLMLQSLCAPNANASSIMLRKQFLELYMKSGANDVMRSTIYSDKKENTPIVQSPAFSILGESTPSTFYEGLDESMIKQGLLPRFLCIEYKGQVPFTNDALGKVEPPAQLVQKIAELCAFSLSLMSNIRTVEVKLDTEAFLFSNEFSHTTTDNLNQTDIPIAEELWNRAHLKMLKLAALVAVGIYPFAPVITLECVKWAHSIVVRDIKNVFARFEKGDIGSTTSETSQLDSIVKYIRQYLDSPYNERLRKYQVDPLMHQQHIVSWAYLSRRTSAQVNFKNDKMGAKSALRRAVDSLIEDGSLQEVKGMQFERQFKTTAKAYFIREPQRFALIPSE